MSLKSEFFSALNAGATWSAGVAFKRSNALPLDRYSVFASVEEARTYAQTNPVAYLGQVITVVTDGYTDTNGDGTNDTNIQSVTAYGIYPVYTKLTTKPADWDTKYKEYYAFLGGNYTKIGDTSAPDDLQFTSGDYYSASKDIMQLGVVLEADNYSIEEIDGVLQLKGFGTEYYAEVETDGVKSYRLTQGFKEGLEPRVEADGDNFKIVWYEPSSLTVEDVNSKLGTLEGTVNGQGQSITNLTTAVNNRYTKTETDTKIAEAIANADASDDFISYTETQELTDEQKELARNNINAVDASLVIHDYENEQKSLEHIPSLGAVGDYFRDLAKHCSVIVYENQNLSDDEKAQARENIGAISQAELDSAVIDGIVVKDTTNSVDYIAKLRLVDGKPVIEYVEI